MWCLVYSEGSIGVCLIECVHSPNACVDAWSEMWGDLKACHLRVGGGRNWGVYPFPLTFYDPVRLKHWPQPHCSECIVCKPTSEPTWAWLAFYLRCVFTASFPDDQVIHPCKEFKLQKRYNGEKLECRHRFRHGGYKRCWQIVIS